MKSSSLKLLRVAGVGCERRTTQREPCGAVHRQLHRQRAAAPDPRLSNDPEAGTPPRHPAIGSDRASFVLQQATQEAAGFLREK